MFEILVPFVEIAAATIIMVLVSAVMNNKKNDSEHKLVPVRIPVKSNRQNRR